MGYKKMCLTCKNLNNKRTTANVVLFWNERDSERNNYVEKKPSYCEDCARKFIVNEKKCIGFLTPTQAEKYITACDDDIRTKLQEDGIAFIRQLPPEVMVNSILYPKCVKGKRQSDELKDNLYVSSGETCCTHRRWSPVYSKQDNAKPNDLKLVGACDPLTTYLCRIVFPHEYYALLAKKNMDESTHNYEGGRGTYKTGDNPVISIEGVNVLIRGDGLKERQSLHIDGYGLKLVFILVDHCGDSGYSFYYIKESHNLLDAHRDLYETCALPSELIEECRVQRNEGILFFESLIHGGGSSSGGGNLVDFIEEKKRRHEINKETCKALKKYQWLPNNRTPTDVSFQFSFQYHPRQAISNTPNRGNIWYRYIDDEAEPNEKKRLFEAMMAKRKGCAKKELEAGVQDFFQHLTCKARMIPRRVCKK